MKHGLVMIVVFSFTSGCTPTFHTLSAPRNVNQDIQNADSIECSERRPSYDFGVWGTGYNQTKRLEAATYINCMADKGYKVEEDQ